MDTLETQISAATCAYREAVAAWDKAGRPLAGSVLGAMAAAADRRNAMLDELQAELFPHLVRMATRRSAQRRAA